MASIPQPATSATRRGWATAASLTTVFLLAAGLRVAHVLDTRDSPTFAAPINDAWAYHDFAATLALDGRIAPNYFFQPFLYPTLLAGLYSMTGVSILTAKLSQAVLGGVTAALTAWYARRTLGPGAGWLAGFGVALLGPLIFFETELLATGLATCWGIALPLLLLSLLQRPRQPALWLSWGLAGGLAVLTRPTFIPFIALATLWLTWRAGDTAPQGSNWRARGLAAGLGGAGLLGILVPAAVFVHQHDGVWTVLPSSGALNLYLGNHPEPDQALGIRPGSAWENLLAEPTRHNPAIGTNRAAQAYWRQQLLADAWQHSTTVLALQLQKLRQLFYTRELPRTFDIYMYREWSNVLSSLTGRWGAFGLPLGLVLPLAAIGLATRYKALRGPLPLFLVCYALAVVAVFPAARYRAPLLPVLVIAAVAGLQWLWVLYHARRRLTLTTALAAAAGLAALLSPRASTVAEQTNYPAEMHLFLAGRMTADDDFDQAARHLHQALTLDPRNAEAHFRHGQNQLARGKPTAALAAAQRATDLDPQLAGAWALQAELLLRQRQFAAARTALTTAVALRPEQTAWSRMLGQLDLASGAVDDAATNLVRFAHYAQLSAESIIYIVQQVDQARLPAAERTRLLRRVADELAARNPAGPIPLRQLQCVAYARAERYAEALIYARQGRTQAEAAGNQASARMFAEQIERLQALARATQP